jgi:putative flavoprotein involved in K+ transport
LFGRLASRCSVFHDVNREVFRYPTIIDDIERKDSEMVEKIETAIIGGGQAGLATSYFLTQMQHEHVVLEGGDRVGNVWHHDRWDSFTFVTPNWSIKLPGAEYDGANPDGFLARREIVAYFQQYAGRYQMPVQLNSRVDTVEEEPSGQGYRLKMDGRELVVQNVVVATGFFQAPVIPSFAANLPKDIVQMHASRYRSPQALPPGAVLVVGSAQSGSQIAEELYMSGRKVFLSVGRAGRVPRRYRGRDVWDWLNRMGFLDRTAEQAQPLPPGRFETVPHLSGTRGGHTINLHEFARDGVQLVGHMLSVQDGKARIAPDLMQTLAGADRAEAEVVKRIDGFIARAGIPAPEESLPVLKDGFDVPVLSEIDFRAGGITSVIWATGYRFNFQWVKPALFETDGFPVQQQGKTPCPGLYFIGLPWQQKMKSGLVLGIAEPAAVIAEDIHKESGR